jgi:hypothetical protein
MNRHLVSFQLIILTQLSWQWKIVRLCLRKIPDYLRGMTIGVILSVAKNLSTPQFQILHFVQDDKKTVGLRKTIKDRQ